MNNTTGNNNVINVQLSLPSSAFLKMLEAVKTRESMIPATVKVPPIIAQIYNNIKHTHTNHHTFNTKISLNIYHKQQREIMWSQQDRSQVICAQVAEIEIVCV